MTAVVIIAAGLAACAYAQKAAPDKTEFPYHVDLLKYSGHDPAGGFVSGNYGANGATGISVFGWSGTGNVAYMIDGGCGEFRGGFCHHVVVRSMVTDRVVFTLKIDSEDYEEEKTFEQIYALKKKEIAEALEKHEIVERKADFLKFPLKTGNVEYKCHLNRIKKDEDGKITGYNIVIVKNGKEAKKIESVSKCYADTVFVCGYFLSPFEPRMLAVTATNTQFEGNNFGISFNGCDLSKGFNEKLAKEVADEEKEIANMEKRAKEAARAEEEANAKKAVMAAREMETAARDAARAAEVIEKTSSYFTDKRDSRKYRAVVIGGKKWMAENLNYKTGNSRCYDNDESYCGKYGRLYDWETAKKACPAGWHLPSREEWGVLVAEAGGDTVAGKALKSVSNDLNNRGNGIDAYGFSALPGGIYYIKGFSDAGKFGIWWTATEHGSGPKYAYYRSIPSAKSTVVDNSIESSNGSSVRCVGD
jgi:uncharacterized protein (TIGR02145 family)